MLTTSGPKSACSTSSSSTISRSQSTAMTYTAPAGRGPDGATASPVHWSTYAHIVSGQHGKRYAGLDALITAAREELAKAPAEPMYHVSTPVT